MVKILLRHLLRHFFQSIENVPKIREIAIDVVIVMVIVVVIVVVKLGGINQHYCCSEILPCHLLRHFIQSIENVPKIRKIAIDVVKLL